MMTIVRLMIMIIIFAFVYLSYLNSNKMYFMSTNDIYDSFKRGAKTNLNTRTTK